MMELIIKVPFETGEEMEHNLNKAIDELSSALKKKGLCAMDLTGIDDNHEKIYTVEITAKSTDK